MLVLVVDGLDKGMPAPFDGAVSLMGEAMLMVVSGCYGWSRFGML